MLLELGQRDHRLTCRIDADLHKPHCRHRQDKFLCHGGTFKLFFHHIEHDRTSGENDALGLFRCDMSIKGIHQYLLDGMPNSIEPEVLRSRRNDGWSSLLAPQRHLLLPSTPSLLSRGTVRGGAQMKNTPLQQSTTFDTIRCVYLQLISVPRSRQVFT